MSQNRRPDFEVFVSQKNADKNFYTKVGAAWSVSNDGISIKLIPGVALIESAVMFPPRDNEN